MNTAEDYIKHGWPITLQGEGRKAETRPITSLRGLAANLRFRDLDQNIIFRPISKHMVAFQSRDYHAGLQGLLNVWKVSNAPKAAIDTARIEGADGESTWLFKLPREATAKAGTEGKGWRDVAGALLVKHNSKIYLPPSVIENKEYVWDGNKDCQELPMAVAELTGMFHTSAFHRKKQLAYHQALSTRVRTPESVVRVKKACDIMQENRFDDKFEDYLDALADVFDRLSDLTPNEGLLIFANTSTLWNNITTIEEVMHFVAKYRDRMPAKGIPLAKQLKINSKGNIDNVVGNAVLLANKIYGDDLCTDSRNGDVLVNERILDKTLITDFLIKVGDYMARFSPATARAALEYLASRRQVSPPLKWIAKTTWDKTPRIDGLLTNYIHAPAAKTNEEVSRWFMLCAVHNLMVTPSPQPFLPVMFGESAATVLNILGDRFCGVLGEPDFRWIRDKWLVGVDMDRLSDDFIKFMKRPYHGGYAKACFYVGYSVDFPAWKTAALENRVLLLDTSDTDIDRLSADMPQLWAEALAAVNKGEAPVLSESARQQAQALTDSKARDDKWFQPVMEWSHRRFLKGLTITTDSILKNALNIRLPSWADQKRVDEIMVAVGAQQLDSGEWHG